MKILAFVDLHGSHKALEEISKKAKDASIIVCAGDVSIFENELQSILHHLNRLNKKVLIIPGNHESGIDISMLAKPFKNIINIHKKSIIESGFLFLGYGGGGFSMVDRQFEKLGKKFEKEIKKNKDKKIILVTHAPPYKTNIDKIAGEHCGNKSLRNFILKAKPDWVISGHLHENAVKHDKIGKSIVINPGPFGKIITV